MDLQNKIIAITGGARGLGAAIAKRLASQSCNLALSDLPLRQYGTTQFNPSGNPTASYPLGSKLGEDPAAWLEKANQCYPVLSSAPGTYIYG